MPQRVNGGVTFVKDDKKRRSGDTFCEGFTVQIFSVEGTNKGSLKFTFLFNRMMQRINVSPLVVTH